MNLSEAIRQVYKNVENMENKGELASYIPELANVDAESFGAFISTTDSCQFGIGNCHDKFSIQSIVKVLSLALAYSIKGEDLWERVGVEPSGTAFNSLVQLEADNGIPRNPFINAGAIVVSDVLLSNLANPKEDFLAFIRNISNNESIDYSPKIAKSEKAVGFRNVALCNLIKALGNIENDPCDVLDFYYNFCSIELTCKELSELFLFLANNCRDTQDADAILSYSQIKRVNALMQTCGFYDESGEFTFKVGLPGKSGVGGGIIAIYPNKYSIAVWSPKLNVKGNSHKGMKFLEEFSTLAKSSIF